MHAHRKDRARSHKQFKPKYPLFWHINEGIEEIMADYVHQEMTRNLMKVFLRLFFLIVMKDVFSFLVFKWLGIMKVAKAIPRELKIS